MTCGADYMSRNHYWVHIKGNSQVEQDLIKKLEIIEELEKKVGITVGVNNGTVR